jgi:hypothetical protein
MPKFILDQEIDLNERDFLGTKQYADNLKRIITNYEIVGVNANKQKAFTIGLFGPWGSGKSSVLHTVEKELKDDKVFKFVNYDAWQYTNDSFRRTFLKKLNDVLGTGINLSERFYTNVTTDTRHRFQFSKFKFLWFFVVLATLLVTLYYGKSFETLKANSIGLLAFIGLVSAVLTILLKLGDNYKTSNNTPLYFAAEQFEVLYNEIVNKAFKAFPWYKTGENSLKKLVIVIDNIDRCNSDFAFEILKDVKTFLVNEQERDVIFIIPVDDVALGKINIYSANEFLRKIFNIVMYIKPNSEVDMYGIASTLNDTNGLNFKNETINLASKEFSKNPRKIIQLFNNLAVEKCNYPDDFATNKETLICAILILREEYPNLYSLVIKSPSILNNKAQIPNYTCTEEESKYLTIFKNIVEVKNPNDINLIVSDVNKKHRLNDHGLTDLFYSFNAEKIIDEKLYLKDGFYNQLIHKISQSSKNGLIKDFMWSYNLVCTINSLTNIHASINIRLKEVLINDNSFNLDQMFKSVENFDAFCEYQQRLEYQRLNNIKSDLFTQIELSSIEELEYAQNLFNACLRNFNSAEDYVALRPAVMSNYKFVDIENVKFSDKQVENIFNENVLKQWVKKISRGNNQDVFNEDIKRILFFIERHDIKTQEIIMIELISKVNSDIKASNYVKSMLGVLSYILTEINEILSVAIGGMIKFNKDYHLNDLEYILNGLPKREISVPDIMGEVEPIILIREYIKIGESLSQILDLAINGIIVCEKNELFKKYLVAIIEIDSDLFIKRFTELKRDNYPLNKLYKYVLHANNNSIDIDLISEAVQHSADEEIYSWIINASFLKEMLDSNSEMDFVKHVIGNLPSAFKIGLSNRSINESKRTFKESFPQLFS